MTDKKPSIKPLLYIQQPSLKTPKATMQQSYQTPKKVPQHVNRNKEKTQVVRSRYPQRRNVFQYEDNITDIAEDDHHTEEESILEEKDDLTTQQTNKKFVDMNVDEKISYFLDRSNYSPILRCEIQTDEKNHRGIITGLKDNEVNIQVGRGPTSRKIPVNKINDIRLLGF